MNKIFKKKHLHLYILLLILVGATLLRFYNFPYRYGLGVETVRDAVIGIEGARQLQAPLVGSFSSLGPFTFGPWYAYQLIIVTLILPFVYSPWIYLGIISVVYVFIMYKVGEKLLGKNFGLLLAFICAISPAQIISGTHLTSHNNTNLFAALSIFIFLKILNKNISHWWGFFLGLAIGIGMNLHFQMSGLLVLPLLVLLNNRKRYLYFITSLAGVIVAFIPLLFFELNNHWFNTRNIFFYVTQGKNAVYVPNRWLFYLRDFWPAFWADAVGTPVWLATFIIVLFLLFLGWAFYKKKVSFSMILLMAAFVFNFIILRYYWGPRFFGYLNFMRPFIFISTAFAVFSLSRLKAGKVIAFVLLLIVTVSIIPKITEEMQQDPFTMTMYEQVNSLEKKFPNKKFSLYTCSLTSQTAHEGQSYSLVLIMDLKGKLSGNGMKVGLVSDCKYPSSTAITDMLFDFSNVSAKTLSDTGWNQVTFSKIYDSHTKWWIKDKF